MSFLSSLGKRGLSEKDKATTIPDIFSEYKLGFDCFRIPLESNAFTVSNHLKT